VASRRFVDERTPDEARRTFKLVKNGLKDAHNLTYREFGLLYVYYPFVLPDVDREVRE
jgi:hypothetical protein